MPKIQMTKTLLGSNDGTTVETFEDGREYVVSADLAANFIGQGAAVPAVQESKVETTANPSQPPAGPTEKKVVAPAEGKPAAVKRAARGGA